ncbi:MAG: diguanylate cyclase [Defluviitaleaceae bacterium]|nr:diguanylate cyclase [Defluviitaleaceae bacterium]
MKTNDDHPTPDSAEKARFSLTGTAIKTKIRNKILFLVIAICLFSIISMSVTNFITGRTLSDQSRDAALTLGNNAMHGARDALLNQANHFLQLIAREHANSADRMLDTVKYDVMLIASVVDDIFNNPHYYQYIRPIYRAPEITEGIYEITYNFPDHLLMTPSVRREIDLLSNLSLIMPVLAAHPAFSELYVGMASGLFVNYTTYTTEYPEYDPRTRPWYRLAAANPGEVIFTPVYEDAFGLGLVMTAAKSVYFEGGRLIGVAAIDILLDNLKEMVLETRITDSGTVFIIDGDGRYIVHPDMGTEGFEPNLQIPEDAGLADGFRRMKNGEEGVAKGETDSRGIIMTFSPIAVADWSLGVTMYEHEVLSALAGLRNRMEIYTAASEEAITDISNRMMLAVIGISLIVIIMMVFLAFRLTRIISTPILKLSQEVARVGEGDFEYRIPVESQDEIGFLTEAFNNMADNLYQYAQDIISLASTKAKLEIAANTDGLTGILNRRSFMETAEKSLELACRSKVGSYVIMMDLDHFKRVNDTYGHPAGDQVLKDISGLVKSIVRSDDLFARYGGEEFILFLSGIPKEIVKELIERIRSRISETVVQFENESITLTSSFGIAQVMPEYDLDAAILCADQALYKAKQGGRNKAVFYGEE